MRFSLKAFLFFVSASILGIVSGNFVSKSLWYQGPVVSVASAEDEDEETEDEYEDDESDSRSTTSSSKSVPTTTTRQVVQNITTYKQVTKTIEVTPEEYQKDTDGDGLVDAIDPNPSVKQSEFFTDTDTDGIPNAFDKHHDEDDFAFFDDMDTDTDNNGILDSYEQ